MAGRGWCRLGWFRPRSRRYLMPEEEVSPDPPLGRSAIIPDHDQPARMKVGDHGGWQGINRQMAASGPIRPRWRIIPGALDVGARSATHGVAVLRTGPRSYDLPPWRPSQSSSAR
jgi:hypothetical protein